MVELNVFFFIKHQFKLAAQHMMEKGRNL